MAERGILIDYHYCTGCHACEVACQQENEFADGQFGITVTEYVLPGRKGLNIDYVPFLTELCNLCRQRTNLGNKPACVKHCLAACMTYGTVDELLEIVKSRPKSLLYAK